ncbi:hydantoinase B/oxoprolinase family protein [Siccirubricoccus sp. G192]|uniref:hydantoinase B/oxoprolinase family protein n=1 Tax=Siccirubricoccus sp. G192 TaxID=2849651 RepID=UPI001C2BCF81|nr:hydantoinase B/oxoprolinase family protein [Siccirubricoccus sp. G192]MBV1797823.1 hydantoinase B/oxoprolinase family protein [Siccirubricoccus sp. G192]
MSSTRGPAEREGDLFAQVAATRAAEQRLLVLRAEHATASIEAAMDVLHDRSEAAMREYVILASEMSLTTMFERRIFPPWGLAGGKAGAPFGCELRRPDGSRVELRGKQNRMVREGEGIVLSSSGGGDYGQTQV